VCVFRDVAAVLFIMRYILFILLAVVGCSTIEERRPTGSGSKPTVVFLSDFGTLDESVVVCKGNMLNIEPALNILDVTHQIPAFSVESAARILSLTTPSFPPGTVFLALVEQHTEGPKRGVVVKSKRGQYFVLPDNGLITLVKEKDGVEASRVIGKGPWLEASIFQSNFRGRDVYSVVAAHIAAGEDWTKVGEPTTDLKTLRLKVSRLSDTQISGEVIALDGPFGNLITNITSANFLTSGYALGETVRVRIGGKDYKLPFVKTFDDVPMGQLLLYVDSSDHLAIAINQGNFASKYKVKPGAKLSLIRKRPRGD
jgi:S-adenosyl-L-methionine hydrolase (adenosine-forming)